MFSVSLSLRPISSPAPLTRRVLYLALAAFVVATALPEQTRAQLRTEDVYFNGAGTAKIPLFPDAFADSYGVGLGLEAGVAIEITPGSSLRLTGALTRYGFSETLDVGTEGQEETYDVEGGLASKSISLLYKNTLNHNSDDVRFYLLLGPGWDSYDFSFGSEEGAFLLDGGRPAPSGQNAFSAEGGFGLTFPLSYTAALYVEPTWRMSFPADQTLHQLGFKLGFAFGEF